MSFGWAIISVGDYADSRGAPAIDQAQDAELVAVYSRDQGRSEAFAEKHGAKTAYTSVEDLLSDSRIDAVYITSPNHLHAQYTTMAANAGKHVLVEKPLSLNLADGIESLRVCRKKGVKLGGGVTPAAPPRAHRNPAAGGQRHAGHHRFGPGPDRPGRAGQRTSRTEGRSPRLVDSP